MQRRESKAAMLQQRADPAASAWRLPSLAAICRLEQRAEAAQERRVVYLIVCGCYSKAGKMIGRVIHQTGLIGAGPLQVCVHILTCS